MLSVESSKCFNLIDILDINVNEMLKIGNDCTMLSIIVCIKWRGD